MNRDFAMLDRILIVDDEVWVRTTLVDLLQSHGHCVSEADSGAAALGLLSREPFALILCDIRMPEMDGMQFLREARRAHAGVDVLLMTGFASIEGAIDALSLGAADYLTKPLNPKEVIVRVSSLLQRRRMERELHSLQRELRARSDLGNMVVASQAMQSLLTAIQRIENSPQAVAICGERGSGKSFTARVLHFSGARHAEPLVRVDCRSMSAGAALDALFGDASPHGNRRAAFHRAGAGSLIVAGLDGASHELRIELARTIREQRWRPRNGGAPRAYECRVVLTCDVPGGDAASPESSASEAIPFDAVITLQMPPLARRTADLPGLIAAFLTAYAREHGRSCRLGPGTGDLLAGASFAGNVAQLFAILSNAAALSVDGVLTAAHLARAFNQSMLATDRSIAAHLGDREYQIVLHAVQRNPRRLDQAARELGVSRTTLWRRMRKYDIKLTDSALAGDVDDADTASVTSDS